jgi:hypothetical protein
MGLLGKNIYIIMLVGVVCDFNLGAHVIKYRDSNSLKLMDLLRALKYKVKHILESNNEVTSSSLSCSSPTPTSTMNLQWYTAKPTNIINTNAKVINSAVPINDPSSASWKGPTPSTHGNGMTSQSNIKGVPLNSQGIPSLDNDQNNIDGSISQPTATDLPIPGPITDIGPQSFFSTTLGIVLTSVLGVILLLLLITLLVFRHRVRQKSIIRHSYGDDDRHYNEPLKTDASISETSSMNRLNFINEPSSFDRSLGRTDLSERLGQTPSLNRPNFINEPGHSSSFDRSLGRTDLSERLGQTSKYEVSLAPLSHGQSVGYNDQSNRIESSLYSESNASMPANLNTVKEGNINIGA